MSEPYRASLLRSGICEKCQPRELKAMRALESLTPSGSEFVNEVERCVSHIRENQRSVIHFAKKAKAAREALQDIQAQVGAAYIGDDKAEVFEQMRERLDTIARRLQEAIANGLL